MVYNKLRKQDDELIRQWTDFVREKGYGYVKPIFDKARGLFELEVFFRIKRKRKF